MSPKYNNFEDFAAEQRRLQAEGKGKTNPADIGYIEAGGNITRKSKEGKFSKKGGRAGFEGKKDKGRNKGKPKDRVVDEIPQEEEVLAGDEDNKNYKPEQRKFYKTSPFDKRNFKMERELNPGRERLETLIKQTKEENELLDRARQYLMGEILEPRIKESYLAGETLESINEKIESRENDLDYLEEGLKILAEKERQQAERKEFPIVGKNENKQTIEARVNVLRHDIKSLKRDLEAHKRDGKDFSKLEQKIKSFEKELLEKESILDFYKLGIEEGEINKISNFKEYLEWKKDKKILSDLGFTEDDIAHLTKKEQNSIIEKRLDKKQFVRDYSDYVDTSIEKQENGIVSLERALSFKKKDKQRAINENNNEVLGKIEEDIKNIEIKLQNAKEFDILLKRGFTYGEINKMSPEERRSIIEKYQTKGMYRNYGMENKRLREELATGFVKNENDTESSKVKETKNVTQEEESLPVSPGPKIEDVGKEIELLKEDIKNLEKEGKLEIVRVLKGKLKEFESINSEKDVQKNEDVNQNRDNVSNTIKETPEEEIKRNEGFIKDAQEKGEKDREAFYVNRNKNLLSGGKDDALDEDSGRGEDIPVEKGKEISDSSKSTERNQVNVFAPPGTDVETIVNESGSTVTVRTSSEGGVQSAGRESGAPTPAVAPTPEKITQTSSAEVENVGSGLDESSPDDSPSDTEKTPQINDLSYEEVANRKFDSLWESREDKLVALGWTKEEYEILSDEEREAVYWRGVKEENYSRNKSEGITASIETREESQENLDENISAAEYNDFVENNVVSEETLENIASVLATRERELSPQEQDIYAGKKSEIEQEILKIQERINKILDEVWDTIEPNEKGEFLINIENDEDREFANKYGKLVVAEIQRRKKEIELTAKGVSLGAKKFLKNEVELSKSEKERQKLFEGLESAYENFDKPKLQEIASLKELATGGDKQKLIERIIEHDITNGLESLDLIQDQSIKDKLDNLNISQKEMINTSPEFFSLTPEKQQYLISKLEQKIYLDADLSSKDQNEEEIKKMGWFKKIGASFRKDGRQAGLRDEAIEKIKNEGLQNYKDDISVLGKYLTDAPNLTYKQNEKGKLVPHFEYLETGNSENKNLETVKSFFNTAASRFGEIPYEWSLKTATSSQQEAYRKAHESYVSAKNALSKTMLGDVEKQYPGANKKGAEEEIAGKYRDAQMEAMLMIRKADAGVNFGRYITQNPEMEKMTSTWLQKTLGTDLGKWGRGAGYAAAGFATKWLGRTFAATGVGLAVAGVAGGFLADRKKRLEFDAKELRKRYGKDVEELGIKKSVNSENVHERLEKLVNQFEKTTEEKSKARILETIKTRLFVTDEMMRDGRINFGKSKDQVMNQFKLSDIMSKASILVEMNGGFGENSNKEVVFDKFDNNPQKEEQVFQRFKQFIKDDKAQSEKDKARAMAALKGAGVAMLGFGIGAGARYAHELGFFESALEKLKDAKNTVGGVTWDWMKGEGGVPEEIPGKVKTGGFGPTPEMIKPEYEAFESMDVGSRGMIGGIQDLQRSLLAKFEGGEIPAQYQEFLEKDAHDIAREWGAYRPGEENESAKVFKGAKFEIGKNGEVVFVDHKGAMQKVFAPEVGANKNFEGDFFNASKDRVPVAPFEADAGQQAVDIEKIIAEKEAQGFERSKSGFGEVLSKTEPTPSRAEPSIWDKPPATEYGEPVPVGEYGDIRGSYKFIEGPDGNPTDIDTRRLISDKVTEFRRNPRSFMTDDLTKTDLLAKTDSFAVKTLTNNREMIEEVLKLRHLQEAPNVDLSPAQEAMLSQKVEALEQEVSKATGGAFDSKAPASRSSVFEAIEKPARVPERTISFDTDEIATESSAPENVSEVAPSSPSRLPRIDFIQSADGKMVIPVSVESFWNYDDNPVARKMAMEKLVNPKYHEVLKISSDFDRLAMAQEYLDSGLYQKGSGEYQGIEDYIARQKEAISTKRLSGAKDVFDVSAESLPTGRVSLGGAEYVVSSRTKINLESNILADIARRYVTGENFEFSGNIMKLGENHVGIYEESSSERVLSGILNSQYRLNADKLGALIEEKIEPTPDGRYRMIRVYKLKK